MDIFIHATCDDSTPLEIWNIAVSRAGHFEGEISETLRARLPKWVYPNVDNPDAGCDRGGSSTSARDSPIQRRPSRRADVLGANPRHAGEPADL